MSSRIGGNGSAVLRGAAIGAAGGLLGAAVMAMYAMVVSGAVKDVGFFTPLYHIASAVIAPDAMMTSMQQAGAGDAVSFSAGPALVGALVHMMTGAMFGAVFGAAVALARLTRGVTVLAGLVYGLVVLAISAFIALPIVAELFGGGEAVAKMPKMAGWGTFTVEHVLFGLVLGAVVAAAAARRTAAVSAQPVLTAQTA